MDLASPLVVVSSKAFHDDAAGTVSAIVGALGLGAGKTSNAAPAFVERRTELDAAAVEALDLFFEHPNCALAAVVNNRTLVPHAIGLEHDSDWLPLGTVAQRARQGGAPAAARRPRGFPVGVVVPDKCVFNQRC